MLAVTTLKNNLQMLKVKIIEKSFVTKVSAKLMF